MKTKSSHHQSENTFKFQTFKERLSIINVDVARKIQRISSTPEDADTFFKEALDKWSELNCTQHFVDFRRGVPNEIQSFAQLVHHQKEIVDALHNHLQISGSLALQPLLDLVVQLGRDLQSDFYPYFEGFLHIIVKILNVHHHDVEILEAAFTCLAYLFKFLWRLMIKDISNVYKLFSPLLSTAHRAYINNFAAESFAFLIRKLNDHDELFRLIFTSLEENENEVAGVGRLLYESVRGVQKQTNSSAEKIIRAVFKYLGDDSFPQDKLTKSLVTFWSALSEFLAKEHTHEFWNLLLNETLDAFESWKKSPGKKKPQEAEHVHSLLQLVQCWVAHRSGVLVICQDALSKMLVAMLEATQLPLEGAEVLLQIVTDFLTAENFELAPHIRNKLVNKLFSSSYEQTLVCDAGRRLFSLSLFEKDVLGCILQYCTSCVETSQAKNLPESLHMLGDLILSKAYPPTSAEDLKHFTVYPLGFPKFQKRRKEESLADIMLDLLDKSSETLACTESNIAQLWVCVICLPHLRGNFDERSIKCLKRLQKSILERSENDASLERNQKELVLNLWSECIVSLSLLMTEGLNDNELFYSVNEMYRKNNQFSAVAKALSIYCSQLKKSCVTTTLLSEENFSKILPFLEEHIASKHSKIRQLTLETCCQFDLPMVAPPQDAPDFQQIGLFQICLDAELVPTELPTYREKLVHLRKLDHRLLTHQLYEPANKYDKFALRYLIGCLYINLKLLWEPIIELIASHSIGLNREAFWGIWDPVLRNSATAAVSALLGSEPEHALSVEEEEGIVSVFTNYHQELCGTADRPDVINFRFLLWKSMASFPAVCEARSEIVIPLFFDFLEKEYYRQDLLVAPTHDVRLNKEQAMVEDDNDERVEQMDESVTEQPEEFKSFKQKRKEIRRAPAKTLINYLILFSKFSNPKSVHMEPRLSELYYQLLTHRDGTVQKVAFDCIIAYKRKYLTPYKENFFRLLDDKSFKDEIVLFTLNPETSVVINEHRNKLLPVLMRVLYGKMLGKSGKDTSGRSNSFLRKNIVMRFIGGCQMSEVDVFLDLIFEPLKHLVSDDLLGTTKERMGNVDLSCILPAKRQLSILSSMDMVFQRLSHLLDKYLPTLFQIIVVVLAQCTVILKRREEIHPRCLNSLKALRQMAMQRLIQFFRRFENYPYSKMEIDAVFMVAVWPQIEKLPLEGVYSTGGSLSLFSSWARSERFLPLLGKHHPERPELTVLPFIFQLLHAKSAHGNVKTMIMEMVENLLNSSPPETEDPEDKEIDEKGTKEENAMEIDSEPLPIEVGESILSSKTDSTAPLGIRLLLNHVPTVLDYLRTTVEKLSRQGKKAKKFPVKEFEILAKLSRYVEDSTQNSAFISLLLPFLLPGVQRSQAVERSIIHTAANLMDKAYNVGQFVMPISRLFSTLSSKDTRSALIECVKVIASKEPAYDLYAEVVTKLNAWDPSKLEEPDYMARLEGYETARNVLKESQTPPVDFMLMLLHNCSFFIRTATDMAMRDNATMCVKDILKYVAAREENHKLVKVIVMENILPQVKSGIKVSDEAARHEYISILHEIVLVLPHHPTFIDLHSLLNEANPERDFFLNISHIQMHRRLRAVKSLKRHLRDTPLSESSLNNFILPLVTTFLRNSAYEMIHESAVEVIGVISKQLPWPKYYAMLKGYIGKIRRGTAKESQLCMKLIVTVLDSFHFDLKKSQELSVLAPLTDTKQKGQKNAEDDTDNKSDVEAEEDEDNKGDDDAEEEMVEDTIEEEESTDDDDDDQEETGTEKEDEKEVEMESEDEKDETAMEIEAVEEEPKKKKKKRLRVVCSESEATRIHRTIIQHLIPKLHRMLTAKRASDDAHKLAHNSNRGSDDEVLRVPIALAMIKLLKVLPNKTLDHNLPGVLLKICIFLRSRVLTIREKARNTLVKILVSLGPRYFGYVLKELRSSLQRGYQLHVLCFTVFSLLNCLTPKLRPGDLTTSIDSLIEICNEELFGNVAEEKEVEGIRGKLKEAKSTKSYEIYKIVSRFVTKNTLPSIVVPLKQALDTTHSHTTTRKITEVLRGMCSGLVENKGLELSALLTFTFGVINDVMPMIKPVKKEEKEEKLDPRLAPPSTYLLQATPKRGNKKSKTHVKTNLYVLIDFGLQIFNKLLKKEMLNGNNMEHLQMVDPFVQPVIECLQSKHPKVTSTALRCSLWLLKYPLPSLKIGIKRMANCLFVLLNNFASPGAAKEGTENFELIMTCFKAVTILVRDVHYYKIDSKQLQVLLGYAEQDIHDFTRQATAFSLLKAILNRKLIIPEMDEVIHKVEQLSVTGESDHVRRQSREVVIKFLMDYPLNPKKLQQHIAFYIRQLNYEEEKGRESVLEMFGSIFNAFPQKVLVENDGFFFIPLASTLVNDESTKCKKLTAVAIKSLLAKLKNEHRDGILNIMVQWFQDSRPSLHKVAALSCGLLVEVEGAGIYRHLSILLPIIEHHLQPEKYEEISGTESEELQKDQVLYSVMNLLIKVLRASNFLSSPKWTEKLSEIYDHVEKHLNHPHLWAQHVAAQLFGLLFAVTESTLLVPAACKESETTEKVYFGLDSVGKIYKLSGASCKLLSSPDIHQELADQVVKNLVWLGKVLGHLPVEGVPVNTLKGKQDEADDEEERDEDQEDNPANSSTLSLMWLMKRMCREARFELAKNPKNTMKRNCVFKWIAAVAVEMNGSRLIPYLSIMLPPLIRDSSDNNSSTNPELKILSQEVIQLLKKVVGMETFTREYASSYKQMGDRRQARKALMAAEAVFKPEIKARKRLKTNLKKVEAKKRKLQDIRMSKIKRKKTSN